MRTVIIGLLSILFTMDTYSQNNTTDRKPVVAGRFYPSDKVTLTNEISELFKNCKKSPPNWQVRAILAPHAGYVFSGKTAAAAYSAIPSETSYKNIFIIGSSHVKSFDGASVFNTGDFLTPMGRVTVNIDIANKLINENKVFKHPTNAHLQEHSLEVQLPFIQYYFKNNPSIVPVIIGTDNEYTVKKIAEALKPWFTPENLFIISSDFSHYPSYKDAVSTDNSTAQSFATGDPVSFLSALNKNSSRQVPGLLTSMCGWTSGLTLLYLAEKDSNLELKLIDYSNSGDSPVGDKNSVVGYHAMALIEKEPEEFSVSNKEKDILFSIVKNTISEKLENRKFKTIDVNTIPANLKNHLGAFVTLKINGELRGCIGRFISSEPLYEVVQASALSSAFEDPRFSPLTKKEYEKIDIEITVIGPLKKINNINEIILGKHGIYIKKDFRSGTMLPQVATENHWTRKNFLVTLPVIKQVWDGTDGSRQISLFMKDLYLKKIKNSYVSCYWHWLNYNTSILTK